MNVTSSLRDDAACVSFEGRFDASWSQLAAIELDAAIRSGRARIELDLERVTFISSVGIGVLLRTLTRIRSVGGSLAVVAASDAVREMLRISKLEVLLGAVAPVERIREETISIGTSWTGALRRVSKQTPRARLRSVDSEAIQVTHDVVALGHVALAQHSEGAAGHYGEGLIAGSAAVVAHAAASRPDCLGSSAEGAVSCFLRNGLLARGPIALHGYFDGNDAGAVSLSGLAEAIVAATDGPVAIVAAGECAGAFGVWARTSPDGWAQSVSEMKGSSIRQALRFSGEPMHAGDSMVAVIIACASRDLASLDGRVRTQLRPTHRPGVDVHLHAHLVTATYRPIPRSTVDASAVGALLIEQPLKGVMHGLEDATGLESAFARGVVWVMELESGEVPS